MVSVLADREKSGPIKYFRGGEFAHTTRFRHMYNKEIEQKKSEDHLVRLYERHPRGLGLLAVPMSY
jgi:hypothetical protein